jgi:hypothetical protein
LCLLPLLLAGIRIDAEQFSRSRMSYYTGLSIVPSDTLVPAAPEAMMDITGYPEGAWLNYVTWSPDGSYIAFTTRSPGVVRRCCCELVLLQCGLVILVALS